MQRGWTDNLREGVAASGQVTAKQWPLYPSDNLERGTRAPSQRFGNAIKETLRAGRHLNDAAALKRNRRYSTSACARRSRARFHAHAHEDKRV